MHKENTVITFEMDPLDKELNEACISENVEDFRKILKIRIDAILSIHNPNENDYFTILGFLVNNMYNACHNSIFDIISKSLKNENYGEACCSLIKGIYDEKYNEADEKYNEACCSLLNIAARKGFSKILKITLSKLKEVEESTFKYWLNQTDKDSRSVLIHAVLREDLENVDIDLDCDNCIDILMEYRQDLDIDAIDSEGNTALHYAVRGDGTLNRKFAKTLIKNGALINVKNTECSRVVDIIPAKTIENILDECIEEPNISSTDRSDENYELKMNFSIFSHKESLDTRNESEFVRSLESSHAHRHLLYHLLVATFLHIKWQKVKYLYYLSFIYNVILFSLIFFYMFYDRKDHALFGIVDKPTNIILLKIGITFLGSLLMVREIVQFYHFKLNYFKSFENYVELTILFLASWMIYTENIFIKQSIEAFLVIIIPIECFLHLEKMHIYGTSRYIKMFRKIASNYIKLIYLVGSMFIAFGLSFYISFQNPISKDLLDSFKNATDGILNVLSLNKNNSSLSLNLSEATEKENQSGNNYASTWIEAIIKTLIMATGQFDLDGLNFVHFPSSVVVAVLFIFSIYLVSMNFLNGIAVSDIQKMRDDALRNVKDQVRCVILFENLKPICSFLPVLKMWTKGQIFENCFPGRFITSYPNRDSDIWVKCNKNHKYLIPTEFVTLAMQRKEEIERKAKNMDLSNIYVMLTYMEKEQRKTENRLQEIENRMAKRMAHIENCLEEILKHTKK